MAVLADDLALSPRRFSLLTAARRNPTIAFGGVLLAALIIMAIFAPLIATSDPFKIMPVNRLRPPSERWWSAPISSAATCSRAPSTARGYR
jgi:peptide/nickel transport system permease protein